MIAELLCKSMLKFYDCVAISPTRFLMIFVSLTVSCMLIVVSINRGVNEEVSRIRNGGKV